MQEENITKEVMVNEQKEYTGPERRRPLSNGEVEEIKRQILDSIYADIGKSIVNKVLWIGGAVLIALFTGLSVKGYIK